MCLGTNSKGIWIALASGNQADSTASCESSQGQAVMSNLPFSVYEASDQGASLGGRVYISSDVKWKRKPFSHLWEWEV